MGRIYELTETGSAAERAEYVGVQGVFDVETEVGTERALVCSYPRGEGWIVEVFYKGDELACVWRAVNHAEAMAWRSCAPARLQ